MSGRSRKSPYDETVVQNGIQNRPVRWFRESETEARARDYYLPSHRSVLRDPSLSPRLVALRRVQGDHFHGTYAYEKSVTRHYAGKFRQHRMDS